MSGCARCNPATLQPCCNPMWSQVTEILEANFGAAGATDPAELCLLYKEVG